MAFGGTRAGLMSAPIAFWALAAAAAPPPSASDRVLETHSTTLQIVDDGDLLVSVLSKEADPDVYVVHPSTKSKKVSYVTDVGRLDVAVAPGTQFDFSIRYAGRLYRQRVTTTDPEAPRYMGAAARPGGVDSIPFKLGPNNAIHVAASINGSPPLDLIFDTGASLSVYGEGALARGARMLPGRQNHIRLGTVAVAGLPMVKIDFKATSQSDGILGFDSFAGRVVAIDYDRQVLKVFHDLPDTAGFVRVPITWRGRNSLVPLTIGTSGGARDILGLFDTGSRWSMTFGNKDAAADAVRSLNSIGSHSGRKADGTSVASDVKTLPWVSLGGYRLEQVQADVERPGPNTNLPLNIIGNDFLKRFNVIIDYRSSELYVRPNHLRGSPYNPVFPVRVAIVAAVAATGAIAGLLLLWRRIRRRALKRRAQKPTSGISICPRG
jgi:hypothetical protein